MKKIALSLFLIAASGAYVWHQAGKEPAGELLDSTMLTGDVLPGNVQSLVPDTSPGDLPHPPQPADPQPAVEPTTLTPPPGQAVALPRAGDPANLPIRTSPAAPVAPAAIQVNVPLPRPRPAYLAAPATIIRAAMTLAANSGYVDGTYNGPTVDAYYGLIQIQAIVQGGRLVGIKVLQYPSDRRTSVAINRQALPMLRDEVVSAQSADVDIISGATLTSKAFIRSIRGALKKASQ